MRKTDVTWRFVMKVVGASLAFAGFVCLVVAFWDKLAECVTSLGEKCKCKRCAEHEDFADELLYD